MNAVTTTPPVIRATLPVPFDSRWSCLPGLTIAGTSLVIEPSAYFQRYESPAWVTCDWPGVRDDLLTVTETADTALEQVTLDYIRAHGHRTTDPAKVLATAWQVYSHIFRDELLPVPGLEAIGPAELQMLREAATLMSLNKVEDTGHISIIGAAWFFGVALPVVFDLDDAMGRLLDEAYHGTWFNESRRAESVLAHAALGGRLVHGCQSSPDMTGGVVAPYGASIDRFRAEISAMKHDMIDAIRAMRAGA